jgi:putative ATPase
LSALDQDHTESVTFDFFSPPDAASAHSPPATSAPLAEMLRPHALDEVIGQRHLLGPGMPLRLAFDAGRLHSMILWGPPGVGKTTLARLTAAPFQRRFHPDLGGAGGGEGNPRGRRTRPHDTGPGAPDHPLRRRSASLQQGAAGRLPAHVESGLITFIGATTENPSFEVVGALLSRAQVYVLNSLDEAELATLMQRAYWRRVNWAWEPDAGSAKSS